MVENEPEGDVETGRVDDRGSKKMKLAPPGEAELSEKITKQLDYYFSDINIIKDKFLLEEFKKDDGWVKLSTLLSFVRLQQLTKDENRIVEALKDFESDIIELDDVKKQVRRRKPIPDAAEFKKQVDLRTVHISGFPVDLSFEDLRTFCSQYGEVESVAMRRHFKTRFFKGCIHTVYKKESDAEAIIEQKEPLKFKDRELRTESMDQYYRRKADMVKRKQEKSGKKFEKKPQNSALEAASSNPEVPSQTDSVKVEEKEEKEEKTDG